MLNAIHNGESSKTNGSLGLASWQSACPAHTVTGILFPAPPYKLCPVHARNPKMWEVKAGEWEINF